MKTGYFLIATLWKVPIYVSVISVFVLISVWNKRHRKGSPCGLLPHQNKDLRLLTPFYQLNCHKFKGLVILESCTEEDIDTEADQCFVTLEMVFEVWKHKITNTTSLWPVQMWSSEVSAKLVQTHSKSALSGKGYEKKSWSQSQYEVCFSGPQCCFITQLCI